MNPYTAAPADRLVSATVVGRSLTRVDAYATAAFAMGSRALHWIDTLPGHDAFVVFPDGTAAATAEFHRRGGTGRYA